MFENSFLKNGILDFRSEANFMIKIYFYESLRKVKKMSFLFFSDILESLEASQFELWFEIWNHDSVWVKFENSRHFFLFNHSRHVGLTRGIFDVWWLDEGSVMGLA